MNAPIHHNASHNYTNRTHNSSRRINRRCECTIKGKFRIFRTLMEMGSHPREVSLSHHCDCSLLDFQNKFEGSTTTGETFVGACATRPKDFKPEVKRIELDGSHDFNTVYRHEYNPRGQCPCIIYLTSGGSRIFLSWDVNSRCGAIFVFLPKIA